MRPIDFDAAQRAKLEALRALSERGLRMEDPSRVDVRGELTFGTNVSVDVNVIFKGNNILGKNVRIGASCIIEDSIIEDDVMIKEFSTVTFARIRHGAQIGPYARIRPQSDIGAESQIGNFVEIKGTTMGAGCKINHHSFVGDARLGDGVIIGAGTITCNHDGVGVNQTVIEDRAYVGSGVMLIAPLTIGEASMIAAGSTITSDVPSNMLAICRTRDIVLKPITKKR
jgi:bifunctional UDP-N-acetylglucosamine pyrophosphorylase/glucosamine-1-phosphate N-acetyltransferase